MPEKSKPSDSLEDMNVLLQHRKAIASKASHVRPSLGVFYKVPCSCSNVRNLNRQEVLDVEHVKFVFVSVSIPAKYRISFYFGLFIPD